MAGDDENALSRFIVLLARRIGADMVGFSPQALLQAWRAEPRTGTAPTTRLTGWIEKEAETGWIEKEAEKEAGLERWADHGR